MRCAAWHLLALWGCGSDHRPAPTTGTGEPATPLFASAGEDVAGPVGTPIAFDGSSSTGDLFLWDFGDGSTAEGAVATHTYTAAGNWTAVLQVSGLDGSFRTDSAVAVAYNAPLAGASAGSMIAVDPSGAAYAVLPEGGWLTRVRDGLSTEFPVCTGARSVAVEGQRLAVSCGDRLEVYSLPGLTLDYAEPFPTGAGSWGVAGTGDGGWRVALAGTGEVVEVRGAGTATVTATVADARGLVSGSSGYWASRARSIDGEGRIEGSRSVVLPFDPGPDSDTTIRGVPTGLEHLVLSPDEGWLYASGTLANTARGLFVDGQQPSFETSVRAFVDAVDPATGAQRWRKQFDDHGVAGPMALSALGNWLFVGFPANGQVLVLDAYSGDISASIQDVGLGVRGLAVAKDRLFVYAWLEREVRAFDIADPGAPALLWTVSVARVEPLEHEVLWGKQIFWDASDTRMTKAGYISCAICHPDGEHDGLTWDFTDRGEGLRNTSSLLGRAGTAMGPLHWTANFDEVQDFEHDIRGPFAGGGFLPEADWLAGTVSQTLGDSKAGLSPELDALAAYVTSLDATPLSPFPDDLVGEGLFVAKGCDACHVPPLFTDSPAGIRHDVGTAWAGSGGRLGGPFDGFDTPTLLGVWQTGPWLHDGSVTTVKAAIVAHVDGLTDPEARSLEAYVLSL